MSAVPGVVGKGDRVAVIGLGSMGHGIALSLRRKGFDVVGCDVNAEAVARFRAEGGAGASLPVEAGAGADVVVSVVVNAEQTEAVLFGKEGCAGAMKAGSLFISSATMAPDAARRLAARAAERGLLYLDAPISGGAKRAAEGELTVLASGTPPAMERGRPVLDAIAKTVFALGSEPGIAAAFKMVNQLLAGIHIAAACEAVAFARAEGLDLERVYEVITQSAGNSWMFQDRVPHILADDYTPRSAVSIFVKDLGIVLDMARSGSVPAPMAGTALQMFLMTAAAGMARDDDASLARLYTEIIGRAR